MNIFIAATVEGRWRPGIGDPDFFGWLTVFAYFFAFYLCARCVLHAPNYREKFIWVVLTGIMLFLALNKQLDLQTYFTQIMKDLAKEQGWYEQRRIYQMLFIIGMGLLGAGFVAIFGGFVLYSFKKFFFPLIGIAFLAFFIVMRAASFHHMDAFLRAELLNIKYNVWMELFGISLVALGAKLELRRKSPQVKQELSKDS